MDRRNDAGWTQRLPVLPCKQPLRNQLHATSSSKAQPIGGCVDSPILHCHNGPHTGAGLTPSQFQRAHTRRICTAHDVRCPVGSDKQVLPVSSNPDDGTLDGQLVLKRPCVGNVGFAEAQRRVEEPGLHPVRHVSDALQVHRRLQPGQ